MYLNDSQAKEDDLKGFHAADVKNFSAWQKIEFLGQLLLKVINFLTSYLYACLLLKDI